MASLTGTKIKDTYDSLLKVSDNGALDGTLQTITDGVGNNSALSLSTAGASVGGTLAVSGAATLSSTLAVTGTSVLTGNVGIGISPNSKLTVNGQIEASSDTTTPSGGNAYFYKSSAGSVVSGFSTIIETGGLGSRTERMRIHSGGDISFRDSSANEAFYWDASSAVLGIGTNNPSVYSAKLYLKKSQSGTSLSDTTVLRVENNGTGYNSTIVLTDGVSNDAFLSYLGASQSLSIGIGSERMRIDSSGNVLVGATADVGSGRRELVINGANGSVVSLGNTSTADRFQLASDSGANALLNNKANTPMFFYTNNTERMRITSGGDIGIGESNPTSTLEIKTNAVKWANINNHLNQGNQFFTNFSYNGTLIGAITGNDTATSYATSSDYRLKEDWVAMEGALDRVDALKPINFAWKSTGKRVDGFLAHEVQAIIPEAVTGEKDAVEEYEVSPAVLDEEGNVIEEAVIGTRPVYQGIDQSKIVPLLVAAIQELKAKVESLEAQLNA